MKLWEAMLKGAKAGPQLFNKQSDRNGGTCAMGALSLGLSGDPYNYTPELVESISEPAACPEGNCRSFTAGTVTYLGSPHTIAAVIMHLNNDHRWSRQRIAEWLANVELKFKPLESNSIQEKS